MSTKCQRQYLKAVLGFNASSNPLSNQQSGFFFSYSLLEAAAVPAGFAGYKVGRSIN